MKTLTVLFLSAILFTSCKKDFKVTSDNTITPDISSSGSGSGGDGGTTTTTGLVSSIGGAYRLIGGNNDSIQVNLSQPAPTGGWIANLSSSDPSVQLPATWPVPQGEYIIHPTLTSSIIPAAKNVTLSASVNGQSKSYVLKVFPLHYSFPAPQLQTPGNGTGVKNRIQLRFEWSNNVNAYFHNIQISDQSDFSNIILEVSTNDPIWAASYFNGLGRRYWRVRYVDGSHTPGPWSATRYFDVKP